jgi:hypothetical protein
MAHNATMNSIGRSRQCRAAQVAALRRGGGEVCPPQKLSLGGVYTPSQTFSRIFCHNPISTPPTRYFETNYALRLRGLLSASLRKVSA